MESMVRDAIMKHLVLHNLLHSYQPAGILGTSYKQGGCRRGT